MQTLVAFAFNHKVAPERVREGLSRVERWYEPLWDGPVQADLAAGPRRGIQLWDDAHDQCTWPSWAQDRRQIVATLHAPLGWERLVPESDPSKAALSLSDRLRRHPDDVLRLTAPFVLASREEQTDRLTLQTDGFGLGRLFEVSTAEGRFWSNRPVAALLLAGVRAEADPLAWRRMAACDWAMGDAVPYLGVRSVPAATTIRVDEGGCRVETLDLLGTLVDGRRAPLSAASLDVTAAALTATARSTQGLWTGKPVLSLSGGRDSRLVAAAYLAAGVEVTWRTYGAASGEADTARLLVELLPQRVEHEVVTPSAQRPGVRRAGAYARARRWHDMTEGLRPALYLRNKAPRRLLHHQPALICGVGGEFGHAPGYPDDVERLERLPVASRVDAFARALQAKVVLPRGISSAALQDVDTQVREVLGHAVERGVVDSKALDWFYADERLRRWGMAGESSGRVMPLLGPEFVSAALGLTTAESRASALHSALISRLVPEWAGIDYYTATLRHRQAVRQQRLWQERDVGLLSDVFADPQDWGDGFDVSAVQSIWRSATAGRAAARDELLLQRVVWRAAFNDHLAAVNRELPRSRPTIVVTPASRHQLPDVSRLVRFAALRANDIPVARKLARTGWGRHVRRRLGV